MSKYTIILSGGTHIDDLTMNGSMFVSETEIDVGILSPEALKTVTIMETDGNLVIAETTLENAVCDAVLHWPEGWLFNLREPTAEEQKIRALEGQVEMLNECVMEMSEIIYA